MLALKTDGTLGIWGNGISTPALTGSGYTAVAAGSHTVALKSDGTIWEWGSNDRGQYGNGTYLNGATPAYVVNASVDDLLSLDPSRPRQLDPSALHAFCLTTANLGTSLNRKLTDNRASGFSGSVYYSALLPANSPLLNANTFAATGVQAVALGRGGAKQTGPGVAAQPAYTGPLSTGNQFAAYEGASADPLKNSNALICMGVTNPELSAKGQVLLRAIAIAIANGDRNVGVTQCPTVQTEATIRLYTGQISGTTSNRTIVAKVQAQPEDYGRQRNLYSWAVAPDGRQFMQTGPNAWTMMSEPMASAMTPTVAADGSPVSLPVVQNLDLSTLVGTLVYVGLGSSWAEVKQLNKAGHYYTVQ